MDTAQSIIHNASQAGASTKIQYSKKILSGYVNGILSTNLESFTLSTAEGVNIIEGKLSEISELKIRENLIQIKIHEQHYYIRFGSGSDYGLASIASLPSNASIAQDRLLSESGATYWIDLLSKYSPPISIVTPKSRISMQSSYETWWFLIGLGLVILALLIGGVRFIAATLI